MVFEPLNRKYYELDKAELEAELMFERSQVSLYNLARFRTSYKDMKAYYKEMCKRSVNDRDTLQAIYYARFNQLFESRT